MVKAGIPITREAYAVANRRAPLPPLPKLKCNGCRACCLNDTVLLVTSDDPSRYQVRPTADGLALAHGPDGNCVYLGDRGCTIQATKPFACRLYDCRQAAWATLHLPPEFREGRVDRDAIRAGVAKLKAIKRVKLPKT